jgi:hypothetical protein
MVRKKKEAIKPVVAKPLNEIEKRNLVTSFVTNDVNENVTNNTIKNDTNTVTNINTLNVTKNFTSDVTKNGTDYVTKEVTEKVTNNVNDIVTDNVTNKVIKKDTKKVTKDVTIIKTISLGKKDIVAKFTSTKRSRPNYNLSEDTIEKIEKISNILGYKKAEFVDIYLNGTLTKVLKDLEKNNK